MKKTRRILSFFLILALLVSLAPATVRADEAMTVSQEMVDVLKTMEGFASKPYWDYKQWTVGYGTECPADKLEEYTQNGIPLAEAEALLRKELKDFEADVHRFAATYSLTLKQQEFDALVSFTYNCGGSWTNSADGYLHNAVRGGFRGSDFLYAICLYSKAGGDYVLQNRRLCEANMYLNGVYKAYNSGTGSVPGNYRYVFLDGNGGTITYPICAFDALEAPGICVEFSQIPTSKKPDGTSYPLTLEGWYTASGKKVEKLDASVENGSILYAKWEDHEGQAVSLSKGEPVTMEVTVTADTVNVRTGPGTFYPKKTTAAKDTKLQLKQIYDGWGESQLGWVKLTNTNYSTIAASLQTFPKAGTVTGSKVNYRNGPSTSGTTVMGQKQKGDRICVVAIDYSSDPAWGQMDNGYWIRLDYVQLDEDVKPAVTGVAVAQLPQKTRYLHKADVFRPEGGILLAQLSDGTSKAVSIKRSMITSFSNDQLGKTTVTGYWEGFSFSFQVEIVGYAVTFQYADGTVIQTREYVLGDTVTPPVPQRPENLPQDYYFQGWDKDVTVCTGAATYTAVFTTDRHPGELTGDGQINSLDGLLLLRYLNGWDVDIANPGAMDVNADGIVDSLDGLLLLRYLNGWDVELK